MFEYILFAEILPKGLRADRQIILQKFKQQSEQSDKLNSQVSFMLLQPKSKCILNLGLERTELIFNLFYLGISKLKLMTDSQFTINCATKWMSNWKRNGWKRGDKSDVKNKEDLEQLDSTMQGIEVKWVIYLDIESIWKLELSYSVH
jgi:hypothetical protein